VLLLDQVGWHTTKKLVIPATITLLPLPARSPELNPVENLWQFIRKNWLRNRIFPSYEAILVHCCDAWNNLMDQPWRIRYSGLRAWAHEF
jgi:transposase